MGRCIFFLLAILSVAGCSTSGTGEDKFSASYLKAHIVPNKTTQAEVQSIYGVPDNQSVDSDGDVSWIYRKNGNLSTASSVANYIPGANAISSALGMASSASTASDAATKASAKMSGSTEYHADTLFIRFNSNKIVSSWHM